MQTTARVIAFANVKGGVGKTTSTIETALALTNMGYKVLVKDADPWGSSYLWYKKARARDTPLPFRVEPASANSLDDEADNGYDYILIDTPQDIRNSMSNAIDRVADIIIIVSKPGSLDNSRTWDAWDAFESSRGILLNFANPRQHSTQDALTEIDDKGLADYLFETKIPQRESIHNASVGSNKVPPDSNYIEFTLELLKTIESIED